MTDRLPARTHPRAPDLAFTELSLGTARWSEMDGPEGDARALAVAEAAWAGGVRAFDTAPYYGSGLCERRLGAALAWKPRGDYVLSTKVGVDLDPRGRRPGVRRHYPFHADFTPVCDYSAGGIRHSFETSLHRMGIPSTEIAYMHGLSICPGGLEAALATGFPEAIRMREEGLARMVGVGANTPAIAMAVIERFDIDMLLFAGGFSLADHAGADAVIAACAERGIGVLAAAPFGNGAWFGPENAGFRERLARVRARFDVSETGALIRFGLMVPATLSVLWSTQTPARVTDTLAAHAEAIPAEFWEACRAEGLIHPLPGFGA
ncbi:aldo/keto reductase [Amaricoccus solimangrovi]|uniref:Aldo/keto reductase n=1 Tax=Amaricoccus solimangrovi TaxID=2589815 RepID=A0A501WMI7_9RHOB|nr:aldo/keto reductase [Amaricoccus solimangrovi]TPE50993.1 aldo/keto reductase [Amaricoccus solimangrovi]